MTQIFSVNPESYAFWNYFTVNFTALNVTNLFMFDGFSLFYSGLILASSVVCVILCYGYIEKYANNREEIYVLMLIAVVGAMLLTASQNLASFFIALELLSVSTIGLISYTHEREQSLEAGVKYMVLSATASATLLMGMAFLFAYSGSLQFVDIGRALSEAIHNPLMIMGCALVIMGMSFKLSLVPFHSWTPDVYQGAPAPAAAFLATVSKVAAFAVLLRFFLICSPLMMDGFRSLLTAVAVISVIVGNLLAVRQHNLKRLLGYSSIAHMGYLMIAVVCLGTQSLWSIGVYFNAYLFTSLGAFGVLTLLSGPNKGQEAEEFSSYRGLFWRRPVLAGVLTIMLLSLAGIPLTTGFVAKFQVVLATVRAGAWFLSGVLVVGSVIGLYYYLRALILLYMTPPKHYIDAMDNSIGTKVGYAVVIFCAVAVLVFGVFPEPILIVAGHLATQMQL